MTFPPQLKQFVNFLLSHRQLALSLGLTFIFLAFLPGRSYPYIQSLSQPKPVVRPVNYLLLPPSSYPVNVTGVPAPYLSSRAAVVIDVDSKTVLFQKNPDLKLLPASTTKIMTALIALETYDLNDVITITTPVNTGQSMQLKTGEKITVENLLYGLLVASGNDAAVALAQNHPDGEDGFIAAMNQKAKILHLDNTHFTNAIGLDAYGHTTTVHDLALLTAEAIKTPTFKKIVATIGITVTDVDNTIVHELETINELLGKVPGVAGVKTGWTQFAGECLVAYTKRDNQEIITVVLGSFDRFAESASLINWAFSNHQWQELEATH